MVEKFVNSLTYSMEEQEYARAYNFIEESNIIMVR